MTSGLFWNATIDVSVVSVWRVDLSVSALSLHALPSRSDRMVANDQRTLYSSATTRLTFLPKVRFWMRRWGPCDQSGLFSDVGYPADL